MIFEEKTILRNNCKNIRKSIDTLPLSKSICEQIMKWKTFSLANNVLIFYPLSFEISLLELLNDNSRNYYFPCVVGDDLQIAKYDQKKGFYEGKFAIKEPFGAKFQHADFIDLAFLPALAVDKQGHRLGYGKGFYDRFLAKYPNITKAVPISSRLVLDKIPTEKHDVKVDYLITEDGITHLNV